jgi:hypothetical protein
MFDPKILPIEFAKWYDEDYCLKAVRQDPYNLRYVHNQTEEICLEAIRQDYITLIFVRNQTEKICLAALDQDYGCLKYVKFHQLSQETIEEILLKYYV